MKMNMTGIFSDQFLQVEEGCVAPILTTQTDKIVWNIFPEFGKKKTQQEEFLLRW